MLLVSFGFIKIYAFGLSMALGFLSGLFIVWRQVKTLALPYEKFLDAVFGGLLAGLFGARLFYIVFHFGDFGYNPFNWVLFLHYPGFNFLGGLIFTFLTVFYQTEKAKINFWQTGDILIWGLLIAQISGNLGEWISRNEKRFLFEAGALFSVLILLWQIKKKWKEGFEKEREGILTLSYFMIYGALHLGLDIWQKNVLYWQNLPIEAILWGGIIMGSAIKFPKQVLKGIKEFLEQSVKQAERRLSSLRKEDPFSDPNRLVDNAAVDTEAKEEVGHERIQALQMEMQKNIVRMRKALTKIKIGRYGLCEECGELIDTDRLAINPTAEWCMKCKKKK